MQGTQTAIRTLFGYKWRTLVIASTLIYLMLSVAANADTYNFFFDGKNKKKPGAAATTEDNQEESAEEAKKEDAKKEEEKKAEAPATTPQSQSNQVTVGTPPQQPIIINNNNTMTAPTAPAPLPASTTASSEETVLYKEKISRWRLGVSTIYSGEDAVRASNGIVLGSGTMYGGLVSLGFQMSRAFGLNLYGGAKLVEGSGTLKPHAGLDLELMTFNRSRVDLNIIDVGLLVGGSTAAAAHGNIGSLHAGARVNINFNPSFGITAVARGNAGYYLLEAGFITRL